MLKESADAVSLISTLITTGRLTVRINVVQTQTRLNPVNVAVAYQTSTLTMMEYVTVTISARWIPIKSNQGFVVAEQATAILMVMAL